MSSETELIRSLQLQVEELKAKLADVQTAPRRSKVIILIFEDSVFQRYDFALALIDQ